MLFILYCSLIHVYTSAHLPYPKHYATLISVIFSKPYYALPGTLGTPMSQTVTLCPRLVFVSIIAPVLVNIECFHLLHIVTSVQMIDDLDQETADYPTGTRWCLCPRVLALMTASYLVPISIPSLICFLGNPPKFCMNIVIH